MKVRSIAKMNLNQILKATVYYYLIFIAVVMAIIAVFRGNVSGVEFTTIVFIFVCGLNSFKSNFYFAKTSGVSRKAFMTGILLSAVPIAIITSLIDQILIRILNIFMRIPNIYECLYNSHDMIFYKGFVLEIFIGMMIYILGVAISMLYYRSNKMMKIIISVFPVALITISECSNTMSNIFKKIFYKEFAVIFGYNSCNVYLGALSILAISAVLGALTFVMIHKAVIKR